MKENHKRLIIVDDHAQVRQSMKALIETNPLYEVIAECPDGASAIEMAEKLNPDIMIVDINMTPVNGFMVTEAVLQKSPGIKIICLSVHNQLAYVKRIFSLGAKGYLTKTSPAEEIMFAIGEVSRGRTYISAEIRPQMENEK